MPTVKETTFPAEALARLRERMDAIKANNVKPDLMKDDPGYQAVRDAMEVIEALESDNAALRNTTEFMRDRVREAIRPR